MDILNIIVTKLGISNWEIVKEITSEAAIPMLQMFGIILVIILICKGIYNYQQKISTGYDYNIFEPINLVIHTGIWGLVWLMWIFNGFTGYDDIHMVHHQGCPIISSMVIACLYIWPIKRTYNEIKNLSEAIMINVFQAIFGFLIASILFCIANFNYNKREE